MAVNIEEIFMGLDRDNNKKVAITEIELLFKEHGRKSHPNIRPKRVAEQILRAFNGELDFIEKEIKAVMHVNGNMLPLEEAMRFFTKFSGYQSFYQDDELQVMLDYFVRSQGKVMYTELVAMLAEVLNQNRKMVQK